MTRDEVDISHGFALTVCGVAKFVLAYGVLSKLPTWDNLRSLDSELRGGHLLDRLHTPLAHYKGRGPLLLRQHVSLLTLQRSQ